MSDLDLRAIRERAEKLRFSVTMREARAASDDLAVLLARVSDVDREMDKARELVRLYRADHNLAAQNAGGVCPCALCKLSWEVSP